LEAAPEVPLTGAVGNAGAKNVGRQVMGAAQAIVHIDNEHVRVTEWRFAPGAATGWHRHEFDYVITPVIGGDVEIVHGDGARAEFTMELGKSYFRQAGVEHDVVNGPGGELRFVEVELKSRPG
jgi:quercetin dioxygenase-like cupin family protein